MSYDWDAHTALVRKHWLAGDWDWTPDEITFQTPRPKRIMYAVCKVFDVHMEQLKSKKRRNIDKIVRARHCAQWMMRKQLNMSFTAIAKHFGVDHTSAMYGCEKAEQLWKADPSFQGDHARATQLWNPR